MKTLCYRVQYQDAAGRWRPANGVAHVYDTRADAQRECDTQTRAGYPCRVQLIPRAEARRQAKAIGAVWAADF